MDIKKTLNVIISLAIAAYILSFLFHLMHWFQVGSIRSIISLILAISVAVQFFLTKQKVFISYISLIASVIIIMAFTNYFLDITVLHSLDTFSGTSVLFIIITHGAKFNQKEHLEADSLDNYEFGKEDNLEASYLSNINNTQNSTSTIPKIAFGVSVGLIIIGMLFKFQHYPGATILNILGFTGAIACVLYYSFSSPKND